MNQSPNQLASFENDGFALLRAAVSTEQIDELTECIEAARESKTAPGMRNLLNRCSAVRNFAAFGMASMIAREILGVEPLPVRAILFDKTPISNWYVTWHQDLSIPVKAKMELPGYTSWSEKEGVTHVQPPAEILERMVSLRIHLDACGESNGPIKFIATSHLSGVLAPDDIARWRDAHPQVICAAQCGDVIAMRPLILHSSSIAETPEHRRVLHLEYAGIELPPGLDWAEA